MHGRTCLSQMAVVASKLAEAKHLPSGDQLRARTCPTHMQCLVSPGRKHLDVDSQQNTQGCVTALSRASGHTAVRIMLNSYEYAFISAWN